MPRITIKPVDWANIAKKILPSDEAAFASFKAKSDGYMRKMEANPPELPKIDWAYYEKNIPIPGLVNKFKETYESLQLPYPEDKFSHLIEDERKAAVEQAAIFKEKSNKTILATKAVLEYYERLKPVKDWNMEESMQIFPLRPAMIYSGPGLDLDHGVYHGVPDFIKDGDNEMEPPARVYLRPPNELKEIGKPSKPSKPE